MKLVASLVNSLPSVLREQVYIWSGRFEVISAKKVEQINTDQIAEWMASLYPERKYPAVAGHTINYSMPEKFAAVTLPFLGLQ